MPASREQALGVFGNPGRIRRRRTVGRGLRRNRLRQEDSTAEPRGTSIRTLAYSATGYLLMLVTGRIAALILGSGDSFAGLGLASVAATILAPTAAAAGATIGVRPIRKLRLTGSDARLSAAGFVVTAIAVTAAILWVDVLFAISTGFLALTASLILRAGLLERADQGS